MQIPYHIPGNLQDYYDNFEKYSIPDFSDKCPICGGAKCASYHGYYTRTAICPITGFSALDLPVLRFLCSRKGNDLVCTHITFSLLPFMLVPYRQLSLKFMVMAVWMRVSQHLSLTRALDVIENELNHLGDVAVFINTSTMMSWEQMILEAVSLFLSSDIDLACSVKCGQLQDSECLTWFLELIIHHEIQIDNHRIRGPDAFSWDFYQQSGGADQCAHFLFGLASQHRL